jgi:hypothetical protein
MKRVKEEREHKRRGRKGRVNSGRVGGKDLCV